MSKSEEIKRDSDRLGVYGESAFESAVKYFLPDITGHSEHYIRMNPDEIEVKNIAGKYINHDFVVTDKEGNTTRVEVKTRDSGVYNNVVIEFGCWEIDENSKKWYYTNGWYLKSQANWYVFVHCSADKAQYQLALIKTEDLKRCVDTGIYRKRIIQGYDCMLIPIADLKRFGAKDSYLSQAKLFEGEPPADVERLPVFEKMEDGTTKVNLHHLFPVHSSLGAIA